MPDEPAPPQYGLVLGLAATPEFLDSVGISVTPLDVPTTDPDGNPISVTLLRFSLADLPRFREVTYGIQRSGPIAVDIADELYSLYFRDGSLARADTDPRTYVQVTTRGLTHAAQGELIPVIRRSLGRAFRRDVSIVISNDRHPLYAVEPPDSQLNATGEPSPFTIRVNYTCVSYVEPLDTSVLEPVPEIVFGHRIKSSHTVIKGDPWMTGIPIYAENGVEIAACSKDMIQTRFALNLEDPSTRLAFYEIVDKAITLIRQGADTLPPVDSAIGAARYATVCDRRTAISMTEVKLEVDALHAEVQTLTTTLLKQSTELRTKTVYLNALQADVKTRHITLMEEYKALASRPFVSRVGWRGTNLVVDTIPIICYNVVHKQWHDIGVMRITIDTSNAALHIVNITRQVIGMGSAVMHHPHVASSGIPCWGNAVQIRSLAVRYMWGTAIDCIVRFLVDGVDMDDASGKFIVVWPVCPAPNAAYMQLFWGKNEREWPTPATPDPDSNPITSSSAPRRRRTSVQTA